MPPSGGVGSINTANTGHSDGSAGASSRNQALALDSRSGTHQDGVRKRRRIPRACDDCRRKKIKCDGKRPCTSCAEFSSECTYNAQVVRPGPAKQEELEKRLLAAESIIRRYLPQVDLANLGSASPLTGPEQARDQSASGDDAADGPRFIPMVGSADQLDFTDSGEYQFHGISSGAAFLSRIYQHLPGLLRQDFQMPFLPRPSRPFDARPLELPVYSTNSWRQANHDYSQLPPRDLARSLCECALNWGSCLLRVVHAPTFWVMLDTLYKEPTQLDASQQRRSIGLLFAVMALGSMYDVDENDPNNPDHYAVAIERGHKYYTSARLFLQDITECSDMITLQAMVFLIQFLQATGNLNGCDTLIGIALRSALRMGLHRNLPHIPMSPIKDETRRRVFYAIRQMEIYLSTTLGLPIMLQSGDIDQLWPTEVDDEYILEDGIRAPPPGTPSFLEAFNAHLKLMRILVSVVEHLYPPKETNKGPADVSYMISYARVREMEQALHDWHEELPKTWRPGSEENTEITRVRIQLRFAYAHIQLMLYRPFLQYYSRRASANETANERCFALATAGINVCRNIIHLGLEIRRQAVLLGPFWFITNTQFFAILALVSYVLYNHDKPEAPKLFAEARLGKECISDLAQRSLAADRVTVALNSLFDKLPDRLWRNGDQLSTNNPDFDPNPRPAQTDKISPLAQGNMQIPTPAEKHPSRSLSTLHEHGPTTQLHAPMHSQEQQLAPENLMDFHLENPFAYPLFAGDRPEDNGFSLLEEDGLQLPFFDLHTDPAGQLLQSQDLLFGMSTEQNDPLFPFL
ncbi:hypothetical protein MCOR02_011725 [Pyricularia oryzae]|uniref:Uncharacterized protein n=1 Tax=Pyricularia oryzae TaxID=318829 RepID=A0A4P7N5P6_PYROR|nr:hypothetical protein MCOR01_000058 [Pyricularia oryzae]KAH9428240.1 hypothetical protein MCOR02_011725 [Pyricularia oryzae]KAI6304502.1 hypothetical protein MCOR34_008775 [Pyricularia oryzae]KAI6490121.1 hypothetical protein MCOR13_008571 [Pyricularia oryzae]KAI6584936.1 hypothetical protein MCOR04_004801 [Pyricularia oryzae]